MLHDKKNKMITAIHQPNFMPWIGFFGKVKKVNIFVFFDDVQFERGKTFTSRTKILVQGEEKWLTVPVTGKSLLCDIKDVKVCDKNTWMKKHLNTLRINYCKSKYFDEVFHFIDNSYSSFKSDFLIDLNTTLINEIINYLNLNVQIKYSSELCHGNNSRSDEKILYILDQLGSKHYVSGSGEGSKRYVTNEIMDKAGIKLEWHSYKIIEYDQVGQKEFFPGLSIVDLLFNKGRESINFL